MASDIELMLDRTLSESAQQKMFSDFAIQTKKTLPSPVKTFVDGVQNADERSVKLDGEIVYELGLAEDVLKSISEELQKYSPVGVSPDKHPGLYKSSHVIFADGVEVAVGSRIPEAREYIFVSALPYSDKIEKGQSSQAPGGVYELTAFQANARFGNVANISFIDYVGVFNGLTETYGLRGKKTKLQHNKSANRFPAIRVLL